jgi:3D (Asp-Asp-Asp) domain-containing protein
MDESRETDLTHELSQQVEIPYLITGPGGEYRKCYRAADLNKIRVRPWLLLAAAVGVVLVTVAVARGETRMMTVTAYCPCAKCCGAGACGLTASGERAAVGLVAADWSVLPRGTRLIIPGYGAARVADRGGAIKGNHIDVFFTTHAQARAWGVRKLAVTIGRRGA